VFIAHSPVEIQHPR